MKKKLKIPAQLSILVIEDSQTMADLMLGALKTLGFPDTVKHTLDCKSSYAALEANKYDLIISDWNLPDGTGFEILQKIKASGKYAKTPFLMVTTENEVMNMLDAVAAGATEYLVKPWQIDELETKLIFCLEKL